MKRCPYCQVATFDAAITCRCGYNYETESAPPAFQPRFSPILADRSRRYWGQVLDALIALAVAIILVPVARTGASLALLPAFGWLAYFLLSDGLPGGQSLGKRMLGLAVVHERTGRPCTVLQSFLRNITSALGIFDWLLIFGERRKRLGDMLAGTQVVVASSR